MRKLYIKNNKYIDKQNRILIIFIMSPSQDSLVDMIRY